MFLSDTSNNDTIPLVRLLLKLTVMQVAEQQKSLEEVTSEQGCVRTFMGCTTLLPSWVSSSVKAVEILLYDCVSRKLNILIYRMGQSRFIIVHMRNNTIINK